MKIFVRVLIAFCFAFTSFFLHAQALFSRSDYQIIDGNSIVQSKTYYQLTTKPSLALTLRARSTAIFTTLTDRCQKELHEVPYRNGLRLAETETEFFPLIQALHINPAEPMDP